MRNIVFVALIIALATVVGCKEKGSAAPAESAAPSSMSSQPAEAPKDQMEAPATSEAPAEAAPEAPAGGDAAPK